MQRNPYIIGLSRQTKVAWLPLPYFGLLLVICVMPYFWTKYLAWILTWPFWYALIFIVSVVNPKSHILLMIDRDVGRSPWRVAIPWPGAFRWRVAARDEAGLEGAPSPQGLICVDE